MLNVTYFLIVQWQPSSLAPWQLYTIAAWQHSTMASWHHMSLAPWQPGSLAPWQPSSFTPWQLATMAARCTGNLAQWKHNLFHLNSKPSSVKDNFPKNTLQPGMQPLGVAVIRTGSPEDILGNTKFYEVFKSTYQLANSCSTLI